MEEFTRLMAADILFTSSLTIIRTAVLYALLGAFIFIAYRRSTGPISDMIFFITFALTVTSSVQIAGVLVVFSLLVGPAFIALRTGCVKPLLFAWITGTIINLACILISYRLDIPTGYTVVCGNSLCALAAAVIPEKNLH